MKRAQFTQILNDLAKKMVLLAGPRQVGKTTVAKLIAKSYEHPVYLNYDAINDREIINKQAWLENTDLLILDELHKMPEWKNYLKGIYDTKSPHMHLLVTGSARLEIFNHVGDSLAGRYFLHHLFPLSPAELYQLNEPVSLDKLIKRSGFPEPFLAATDIDAERWRMQYINSLLSTDVFEFEKIQHIRGLQLTFELLRTKVGSPISYQSIAEDVAISPTTVKKYIEILEAIYVIFKVTPHHKNIARSVLKEPKIYFFDTALVKGNIGIQFENCVANALFKHCAAKNDYYAEKYSLHYLRDKEKHEVDFALVKEDIIEKIIEVKNTATEISKSLYYFHNKYNLPAIQLLKECSQERKNGEILVLNAANYLKTLVL